MSWYAYEDAREQKEELRRELDRRRRRGEAFEALTVPGTGRKLTTTFWGKAWNQHLERYQDYESRLPRGRSYLRQGNVYNLTIEPGIISATVAGSSLYEVTVRITPLKDETWRGIKEDCAGQVASLLDLLGGRLGDGVLRAITDPARGLFPKPKEIRFSCSCPDHADMCKHVAAVLYGVGVKLDSAPDLFFVLRSVDPSELLANAAHETLSEMPAADSALAGEDLSALFGIDLGNGIAALPDLGAPTEQPATSAKPKAVAAENTPGTTRKKSRRPTKGKSAS